MQPLRRINQKSDHTSSTQSSGSDALSPMGAKTFVVGTKAVVFFEKCLSQQSMTQARTMPASQRLIRNGAGLFFKGGEWTADASDATVFSTIAEAVQARAGFGLEDIQLVLPQQWERPQTFG